MTEDTQEVYIGDADIFLTLLGFRRAEVPFVTSKFEERQKHRVVPAYQSIYDGYALYAGAEFKGRYYDDFDLFADKSAG